MNNTSTALITGASGGIGMELARIHASKGNDVVIVARSEKKLQALKKELELTHKINAWIIVADLSKPESAKTIYEKTQQLGIKVSILINNAGLGGHGLFHQRDLSEDQAMIQINLVSLTNLTHYYLKDMVKDGYGKILNVSSTASFMPGPLQSVYYGTKAYVTSFTQAIAEEVKDYNITVTALCPGAVTTGFIASGNLEGISAWNNAKSAKSVAMIGYKDMQRGKLVSFNEGLLQFVLTWIIPLLPRKVVLKVSRYSMEKQI